MKIRDEVLRQRYDNGRASSSELAGLQVAQDDAQRRVAALWEAVVVRPQQVLQPLQAQGPGELAGRSQPQLQLP